MVFRRTRIWIACLIVIALSSQIVVRGVEPRAAELLPSSTLAYFEIRNPQRLIDFVLDHPIRNKIEALEQVKRAKEERKYLEFKAVVAMVEAKLGQPWRKLLSQVAGQSLALAFDPTNRGSALIVHTADESTATNLVEAVVGLAQSAPGNARNKNRIQTAEYRGTKVYSLDKIRLAVVGQMLIVTNNGEQGKQLLDAYFDRPQKTLATDANYLRAESLVDDAIIWSYANVATLRQAGGLAKFFKGPKDNPVIELLLGGVFGTLQNTPLVALSMQLENQSIGLTATAPYDAAWTGESREYFLGTDGKGSAGQLLTVNQRMLALSAYRDIAGMWLRSDDLFNQKINDDLAKADSNLSTFFGGKDFAEDILAAMRPELQLIVARQSFVDARPVPTIKLPAFGLVADLKDPIKMQPELRRTFQSVIGFLNIVGAMNGQPQLELDMEKSDQLQLITSRYLPDSQSTDTANVRIHHNFSPSIAFAKERFVIASTQELARELAFAKMAAGESASSPAGTSVNTRALIDIKAGREILADNRSQLIAQNMIKEGQTQVEAEAAISTLLELVGWLRTATLRLETSQDVMKLAVTVETSSLGD